MDGRRQELEKLRDEIEKKGALMTADARRERQETFERKRRDAARAADDYQKELEKKEGQLLQKVLQEVGGVIEKVGKEKNYYMIVEKGTPASSMPPPTRISPTRSSAPTTVTT